MPPKEAKGKDKKGRSKKGKQTKVPPDLDELYIQSLDETHYLSKSHRESLTAAYMQRIDTAIKAFTIAQPPIESATLLEREEKISKEILTQVPMVAVPHIVRALGMNPTTQQMLQIGWIVFAGLPQPEGEKGEETQEKEKDQQQSGKKKKKKSSTNKGNKNNAKGKGGAEGTKPDGSSAVNETAVRQMVVDTTRDMQLEEAMRAALSPDTANDIPISIPTSTPVPTSTNATVTVAVNRSSGVFDAPLMADRQKLETLLLRLLHTGLLVFDPLSTGHLPAALVHPRRIVTVIRRGTQETMDDVFDALWVSSRRYRSSDGTRYITTSELQHALETTNAALAGIEPAFTQQELEAFLQFVCDSGMEEVREDTFALAAMCGC